MWQKEMGGVDDTRVPILMESSALVTSLTLRPLHQWDRVAVQELCTASFPIQYPECWFDEVVSGSLHSMGLFDGSVLAAMIVSETKSILHCNPEDRDILADSSAQVVYILSLAVGDVYRRAGLASRLLNNLFDTVVCQSPYPRAVFLHVLSTNVAAINFYRRNGFLWHASLLNYYRIGVDYGDGCTYVKYTNGSHPPVSFYDVVRSIGSAVCFPLKAICKIFAY